MKVFKLVFLVFFTLASFEFVYFSHSVADLREVVVEQEITTDDWVKLDSAAQIFYLEFLDGQDSAYLQTEKMPLPQKLTSKESGIDTNEKEGVREGNLSNFLVNKKASNWIKVESKGKVRVHAWLDDETQTKEIGVLRPLFASLVAKLDTVKVISRSQWGADESLRYNYSQDAKIRPDSYNVKTDYECNGVGSDETTYAKIIYQEDGNPLLWPLQYSSKIKKIVVHHTAEADSSVNLPGDQKIRAIYRYHTLTRQWGDIGYHYVIDQKGNIYEGRSGGDYVVGAHVKCFNIASVSVSLMGNFQNQNPTLAQLKSLSSLVGMLGAKYGIQLDSSSYFHGEQKSTLVGHRDLAATACPGDNLYSKIPNIAKQVALSDFNFDLEETKVSISTKIAEISTDLSTIEIGPTSKKVLTFAYKNTGNESWGQGTWLYVSDNNNKNLYVNSIFADKNYVAANLREKKVYPGGVGHFDVEIESGYQQGLYSLELVPIINGTTKFTKGTIIQPIKVTGAENSYQFLQLKAPPKEIYGGQSFTAKMKLENTGNTTWFRSGEQPMRLKAYPIGRESDFVIEEDGYDKTVLGRMVEPSVKPGEIATFEFVLKAPAGGGDYEEKFIPAIGNEILGDRSMQFNIKVNKPNYRAQLLRSGKNETFLTGEKKTIRLGLKNISDVPWENEQVGFRVLRPGELNFDVLYYPIAEFVPRHQAGYTNVTIQAPDKAGTYKAVIIALANKKKFEKLGMFEIEIEVEEPELKGIITYQSEKEIHTKQGEVSEIVVRVKNKSDFIWEKEGPNRVSLRTSSEDSDLKDSSWHSDNIVAYMEEDEVKPGNTASFKFKVKANKVGKNQEDFFVRVNSIGTIEGSRFELKLISGQTLQSSKSTNEILNLSFMSIKEKLDYIRKQREEKLVSTKKEEKQNEVVSYLENDLEKIRVKLSFPHEAVNFGLKGNGVAYLDGQQIQISKNDVIWARSDGNYKVVASINGKKKRGKTFKVKAAKDSFVTLRNWSHNPGWTTEINDNFYRGTVEISAKDSKSHGAIDVVNELGFEDYLKGIAEVPEGSSTEKRKALAVVARSYAMHYTKTKWRKFPSENYDASDSPAVFQKYLGAGYEQRSPKWQEALKETEGEVLIFNGEILRTAYFSCSNGKTKTPEEANWNSQYFQEVSTVYKSVNDSYGKDPERYAKNQCGHGVGLSGLGAENLAQQGWSYKKILSYYYQGVSLEKR